MSKQPKFKITGPGEYRTRDGRKAVVLHKLRGQRVWPFLGYIVENDTQDVTTWQADGVMCQHGGSADLVCRVK